MKFSKKINCWLQVSHNWNLANALAFIPLLCWNCSLQYWWFNIHFHSSFIWLHEVRVLHNVVCFQHNAIMSSFPWYRLPGVRVLHHVACSEHNAIFFFTFLTYLLNFIPQSCNRRFSTHLSLGFFLRISFWGRVIAFTLDAIDTMSFLISPKILLSFNESTHFYSICHDFHFLSKFCNNWCILWAKGKYLIFVK